MYEIYIRDNNFNRTRAVKYYSKLEINFHYQDVSTFTLEMPNDGNTDTTEMFNVYRNGLGYGGIVVVQDGTVVFSGPVRGFESTGAYESLEDLEKVTFFGIDDTGFLGARLCMIPDPNFPPPDEAQALETGRYFVSPYGTCDNPNASAQPIKGWGYFVYPDGDQSIPANQRSTSQAMYNLVTNNIGPTSPWFLPTGNPNPQFFQNRRIPNVRLPEPRALYGPPYVSRSRYENLLQTLQEIAVYIPDTPFNYTSGKGPYEGLGFRMIQTGQVIEDGHPGDGNQELQFQVYEPNDFTNTVIFSKGYKNLGTYRYTEHSPEGNFGTCGGQNHTPDGVGFDVRRRWFFHSARPPSVNKYGLWEYFADRRDVQYPIPDSAPPLNQPPVYNPPNATYNAMLSEVNFSMLESLIEKREIIEVEVETLNIPPTKLFEDYNLGDKVTVIIPEHPEPIQERIREITLTLTYENAEKIVARIGTEPSGRELKLFDRIKRLREQANQLDKNY